MRTSRLMMNMGLAMLFIAAAGCGAAAPSAPSSGSGQIPRFTVTGTVRDRLTDEPISGSTISFGSVSGTVMNGTFSVPGVVWGDNRVVIAGPSHVTHETRTVTITQAEDLSFSVITWGTSRFGATYDEAFHQFFHQFARVSMGAAALRKWAIAPSELYLVSGTVPAAQFDVVATMLDEVNQTVIPDLWCGLTGPLPIRQGPDVDSASDGQIVVRPNWDAGSNGTVGNPRSGFVNISVFGPASNALLSTSRIAGILAHELSHVAGGYHVCGGDLGTNPFGFSRSQCPFPDSLMANLGDTPRVASPEDKLAACLIYHPDTHVGNLLPDINPTYR